MYVYLFCYYLFIIYFNPYIKSHISDFISHSVFKLVFWVFFLIHSHSFRLNGHEYEQSPGESEGQGSLECYSLQGLRESDMTQQLNNNNIHGILNLWHNKVFQAHLIYIFLTWIQKLQFFLVENLLQNHHRCLPMHWVTGIMLLQDHFCLEKLRNIFIYAHHHFLSTHTHPICIY